MPNTFQILINWDRGNAFAERMAAKLIGLEGYTNIDPQCPNGGPDGTKDILCEKDRKRFVAGCYFPTEQKSFGDIRSKFEGDYAGVKKHSADGFIFVTNQKITPAERKTLIESYPESVIYHGERICGLLDSPSGYGVRLEFLDIELTKEEQLSFLDRHLNLESRFSELNEKIDSLSKVTNAMAGLIRESGRYSRPNDQFYPIAGIPTVKRLSIEDIFAIHTACMYEQPSTDKDAWGCYRRTEVWIGRPGCSKEEADFLPVEPSKIPELMHELMVWWRSSYEKALYADEPAQLDIISEFHARLLEIHPFLDGNGRVARVLTSLQCVELFGKKIKFQRLKSWEDYYDALVDAQRDRNFKPLVAWLKALSE